MERESDKTTPVTRSRLIERQDTSYLVFSQIHLISVSEEPNAFRRMIQHLNMRERTIIIVT